MEVRNVPHEDVELVLNVLCEAFYHYPVMRFVLGPEVEDFDTNFPRLIRLFVTTRVLCDDPLFGIDGKEGLAAAATVTLPESRGSDALDDYREAAWRQFTTEAKARYTAFRDACNRFDPGEPHYHLNMIGVRNAYRGVGLARLLIEEVIRRSDGAPQSKGVSLSTEAAANVPLYEHMGFEQTGHCVVGPGLETWNFYRPKR